MPRAALLLPLLAGLALGAAPPAQLTPDQEKLLRERPGFITNEKTLEIEVRVYGPWHVQVETTAERLAGPHRERGEWAKEAKYRRVVLEARRALLGEGHWRTVDARLALAEALAQARRTAEQREALGRANGLTRQAIALQGKGQAAKAVPLARQALAIYKEALGEKHPSYAIILNNLACLYQDMGARKAALPLFKEALAIRKEVQGEKHPDYAGSLNNLAALYHNMGEFRAALPLYKRALAIRKETLGEKHAHYAVSLGSLAELHKSMGEHKAALPLLQKALAITREALGEKHPDYAQSLHQLAALYRDMGDHKAALPLYQKALEIIKPALGEKHPLYANSLHNLAALYRDMGDHKAALTLYHKALDIWKQVLGEGHPDYATCLHNLAALHYLMGDLKAALPLYKKALAIYKEALGEKHPHYATSLNNLGMLYFHMGDYEAALPLHQKALDIRKQTLGEKHPGYATSLHNLARLYHGMGEHKAALPLYKKALAIYREALGERHPSYATSLNNLARLYQSMGDHKVALPLAEEAAALILAQLRDSASVQSDRQQLAAADDVRQRLDVRLSLGDTGCYGHELASKGAVLLRQRQRRLFTALSANPRTRQDASELQFVTRQIAALSASPQADREQLERLTEEQERLQAKLSELSAEAKAAFQAETLTPQALAGTLPEGAVLVDYLFYCRYGTTYRDGRHNVVRHLVAFVSRGGKPTARIDLGPASKVQDAVVSWRQLLAKGKAAGPLGGEVKRLIWSPLEKHLLGAKVVLISPDGPLGTLPFAALPGKKEGTYLIEDVALAIVPVPQMLPEMLKPVDKAKRHKPSLLVVSDVDYDKSGAAAARVGDRGAPLGIGRSWSGLPATRTEANDVKDRFSTLFEGGTVTDLKKSLATKTRTRNALPKVRYAHFATHGFFAQQQSTATTGLPSKPGGLFGQGGVTGWHPLLLSGVVLAGANKEPKAGEEDGILTALEVSEMQLPRLELVVLSACETGLGEATGGEGLLGLQRAFQVAGARTVIASLWQVDDRATQALMSEFYRIAWDTDTVVSRAEALRRAQLAMLKEGKRRGLGKKAEQLPKGEARLPPLYWAAFVLSGDWR